MCFFFHKVPWVLKGQQVNVSAVCESNRTTTMTFEIVSENMVDCNKNLFVSQSYLSFKLNFKLHCKYIAQVSRVYYVSKDKINYMVICELANKITKISVKIVPFIQT